MDDESVRRNPKSRDMAEILAIRFWKKRKFVLLIKKVSEKSSTWIKKIK